MYRVRTPSLFGLCLLLTPIVSGCGPSRYANDYDDERYQRYERRNEEQRQSRATRITRSDASSRVAEPLPKRSSQTAVARSEPARTTTPPVKPKAAETAAAAATAEPVKPVQAAKPATPPAAAASSQSAPAASAAVAKPVDETAQKTAKKQLEDGYRLLRAGFVKKARERFDLAMNAHASEASLAQGRSMDPSYLKTVAFPDVKPDAEEARRLYRRAIMLGSSEAKGDLERLEKALAAAEPAPAPAAANSQPPAPAEQPKPQ